MSVMSRLARIAALALIALAAGCGGGDGGGEAGGGGDTANQQTLEAEIPEEAGDAAGLGGASEAGNICVNLPMPELARQYGVAANAKAVAKAVAEDVGGTAEQQARNEKECLRVLAGG